MPSVLFHNKLTCWNWFGFYPSKPYLQLRPESVMQCLQCNVYTHIYCLIFILWAMLSHYYYYLFLFLIWSILNRNEFYSASTL